MKLLTIFGTRPEIIRLSEIVRRLDRHCEHVLVHTGQNSMPELSDVFFHELQVRTPDVHLGVDARGFAEQLAQIVARAGAAFESVRPDRVLVLGDTNSGLAAIVAARLGIPVFHLEAGNRCYDDRVPEEVNRRLIDHASRVLLPYTERSKENLVREGIERQRIFVVGNPIFEVLARHEDAIAHSSILQELGLSAGAYFLATLHRAENVDVPERLAAFLDGLSAAAERHALTAIVSVHPRTADRLARWGLRPASPRVRLLAPLGFFAFVRLERHARAVLSDSGTVQEECSIFGVPSVTLRDTTERPETVEAGSAILSGADPARIVDCLDVALGGGTWTAPAEYLARDVSTRVAKVVLGT